MPCLEAGNLTVCVLTVDAWRRIFARCPVCKTRRLILGEFQDWYGERFTCLTCGSGWMDGELRKTGKRERADVVRRAKQRVRDYVDAGIAQGFDRFMEKLKAAMGKQ